MEKSSGFDMSKLSTASKIVMVSGILLLIDSFLSVAEGVCRLRAGSRDSGNVCGEGERLGREAEAASASSWASCVLALLIWEGIQLAKMPMTTSRSASPPSKVSAYLGFGVVVFGC